MSGGSIFWIASYPKSGNTWVRCLLDSLLRGGEPPRLDMLVETCPNGALRSWLEELVDVPSTEMTAAEIFILRAAVYRQLGKGGTPPCYVKLHDCYDPALIPPEASAGVVYVLRDPRDVAPSWADFMGQELDETIDLMALPNFTLGRTMPRHQTQAEQVMGSWSENVTSWLEQQDMPVLLLRFEEMMAEPKREAARLAEFLRIKANDEMLVRAVAACSFDQLRGKEEAEGFIERPDNVARFFRQGKAGAWSENLSQAQALRIEADHGELMQRFGYKLSGE